ncbi:MAG: DUF3347 domain-containing protein [Chitinophagaceae bacterium]
MRKIFFGAAILASLFTACNNSTDKKTETQPVNADSVQSDSKSNEVPKVQMVSAKDVVAGYIQLKNALASDNSEAAATAGNDLNKALQFMDSSAMSKDQLQIFTDVADDAKEHAEHIGANAGNIKHQREHFQELSKDVYDLVKAFGTNQVVYKDYCPMAKAIWLSETKEIRNPYYGSKMSTCGQLQETIAK